MNKEKEIEDMANALLQYDKTLFWSGRFEVATALYNAGYGNVKQAVKEFAEKKVKPLIDELVEIWFMDSQCQVSNCHKSDNVQCGSGVCIEENQKIWENKIDNLITELYGADE